tara:strand:- start:42 stop:335 length:294 start_codon:yes stop_codon:yes gene_type:complete
MTNQQAETLKQLKAENKKLHEQKQTALERLDKSNKCSIDVANMKRKLTAAQDRQGKLTRENKQLKEDARISLKRIAWSLAEIEKLKEDTELSSALFL